MALPAKQLSLFLDDQSFAQVLPDDSGNWSVEADTNMLAARAMVTFEQAKQPTQDAAPAEPPKAGTP